METFVLKEESIRLGQALKATGIANSGVEAKFLIQDGLVKVDGQTELRRGRKLYDGSVIEYGGRQIKMKSSLVAE